MKSHIYALILIFTLALRVAADTGITVETAWIQAAASADAEGAVTIILTNHGETSDRLLGAHSDIAETVELRTQVVEGYAINIKKLKAIDVNAGDTIELKPFGPYFALLGLKQDLTEGQRFELILQFEKAGEIPIEIAVKK